ncbi:MAG: histidine kinase [Microbacterium sp.]|nr:MAG: histidine kinase [Microbacterium sp.]
MPDNVLLQAALAAVPARPQSADVMNVTRQALQGQLYVRAQGDAQAQLAEGKGLSLAITTHQDKRFLLVFSGGAAMQASATAEGTGATSAVSQSASNVLRMAVDSGYDGVYLDHADEGARLVLPIELVRKSLDEGAPPFELKTLLAGARTDATAAQVAAALARAPRVWVAGGTDPQGRMGLAEARDADGSRRLEVYSHPLELLALARGDRALPLTPEQLARALASDVTLTGIVLDPAGPWIELDRADLSPLLALAG